LHISLKIAGVYCAWIVYYPHLFTTVNDNVLIIIVVVICFNKSHQMQRDSILDCDQSNYFSRIIISYIPANILSDTSGLDNPFH